MTSNEQLEANRANSKRSSGPQTAVGKANSSRNALKHGLCAKTIVIGDETAEQFEELREAVTSYYRPTTTLAHEAADRYAATLWRLRRIPAIEAAFAEAAREQAYVEECKQLKSAHDAALGEEAEILCDAVFDNDGEIIGDAMLNGDYCPRKSEFLEELVEKKPFQAPEKRTIPAAQTFLMLIEAAESLDFLGKLSRYETTLMNIASRQRTELEAYRAADEDPKLIDL
jgi:hypothetical protein